MDLEKWVGSKGPNQDGNPSFTLEPLQEAVLQFQSDAKKFEEWEMEWETSRIFEWRLRECKYGSAQNEPQYSNGGL